jgi:hypothetical protein
MSEPVYVVTRREYCDARLICETTRQLLKRRIHEMGEAQLA